MKKCLRCNYSEEDDSAFCSNCGYSFKVESKDHSQSKSEGTSKRKNKKEKIYRNVRIYPFYRYH